MSPLSRLSRQRFWIRQLRNAAALARLQVLACLKTHSCRDEIGKGAGGDVTKRFDYVTEQTLVDYLRRFASFTLVSEETGTQKIGSNPEGFLIMDPIDGSTNVSHGISFACIAIAFGTNLLFETVEAAVVLDLFTNTCYHAIRGKGAFRDNQKIHPATKKQLKKCLVGVDTTFPAKLSDEKSSEAIETPIRYTRHLGSNALELCYVADGSLDGFIDLRGVFRGTDLAAAALILEEAGAALIDQKGKAITGECTNEVQYALIAGRDANFAKTLLALASERKTK